MRRMPWVGVAALIVSLALVGVIRAATPENLPTEFEIHPDRDGVVRSDEVTVELVDLRTASAITSANEYVEEDFIASPDAVLVLARFKLVAHGDSYLPRSQLRTADGYSYEKLTIMGFPMAAGVEVGQSITTTFIYEIPVEKLSGVIGIHGLRPSGLQPVSPLIVFELPEALDPDPGVAVVPEDVLEPVP